MTHTTSLELSKRLKEVGVPQKGEFYWNEHKKWSNFEDGKIVGDQYEWVIKSFGECGGTGKTVRAFLASELSEILPERILQDYALGITKIGSEYIVYYCFGLEIKSKQSGTLQEAMGEMVYYLAKEGLITI